MIYFLLGFLMAVLVWPLCSSLEEVLEQLFEYWKTKIVKKMYDIQKEMEQNENGQEQPEKHYGFYQAPYPDSVDSTEEDEPESPGEE